MNISLVIIMSIIYTLITIFWIISLCKFYSRYIFIFGIFIYFFLIYYYLKSFFTEPGIIPRGHPKYILNKDKFKAKQDSENIFKIIENLTKSNINIDVNDTGLSGIKNLEDIFDENKSENNIKKTNKIFPDFILAESEEDLNINKNINNSIILGSNTILKDRNLIEQDESILSGNKNIYMYSKIKNRDNSTDILKKSQENFLYIQNNPNNKFIPHIYTKRPCYSCNIIRPPEASHCVICDNCIKQMDHHCFYISNCVGERNRKFFVLFLIYGFIISLLFISTSLYYLIYTFFINNKYKYLTKSLFNKYIIPIIISFIIMFIGILILFIWKNMIKLSCSIFIFGNILFDILFYINLKRHNNEKNNLFNANYHPLNISLIYAVLPLLILVSKYLRKQIKLIGKNLTTKQYFSIKEEKNKNKQNLKVYYYLESILQRKVDYKNIFKFFFKKQSKSLIYY